jgi:hypothetical protein
MDAACCAVLLDSQEYAVLSGMMYASEKSVVYDTLVYV